MDYYRLNGTTPVVCKDILEWAEWFESNDRTINVHTFGKIKVSTVFLGMPSYSDPPDHFETMIFGGEHDQDQWQHHTYYEAAIFHHQACMKVLAT